MSDFFMSVACEERRPSPVRASNAWYFPLGMTITEITTESDSVSDSEGFEDPYNSMNGR